MQWHGFFPLTLVQHKWHFLLSWYNILRSYRKAYSGGQRAPPSPRHFCRIINNFLLFYHGQLIRTILEILSKRRVACLEQETTYVAASQLALSFALPSPTSPYRRLSWVVFVVGTVEDCILGVQTVVSLFQAFRWWGTRRTSPESPEQAKLLAAYKKDRGLFFIAYLGEGVRTKLNVQFYFERPHFLFLSTATGKPRNI